MCCQCNNWQFRWGFKPTDTLHRFIAIQNGHTHIHKYQLKRLRLYLLNGLLTIIPCAALAVRRIHDTNRTGWYLLLGAVPIIGFVLLLLIKLQKGSDEANRYGEALL